MEKAKTPQIRFKGYTDDWEQRELGALVEIGDIDHRMPPTVNEGIPYLMTGDFLGINELNFSNTKLISKDDYMQLSKKIKPQKGDILFARYASVGDVRYIDFERDFLISYSCAIIKSGQNIIPQYLYHYLTSVDAQKQIQLQINTGSQANIGIDSMKNNITVSMPSSVEQNLISNYLTTLDNLITCHQRKYDKLINVKKSLLEKMFPKNGESVPEIRFAGFTDAWEQREAIDIFNTIADKGYPELPVLSATQEYGMVKRSTTGINIHHDKDNEAGYKRVQRGNFVMHLRSFQGGFAHSDVEGITSPAYTVLGFKEPAEHNDCFWKYILSSESFIKRLELITYGIRDGRSINFTEFAEFKFYVPSCKEQNKIADYFTNLDNLITCHQRELEKLKNIKKSLLEKMFV